MDEVRILAAGLGFPEGPVAMRVIDPTSDSGPEFGRLKPICTS